MSFFKKAVLASCLLAGSAIASESLVVRFDLTPKMKRFLKQHEFDVTGVDYKKMQIEALLTPEEFETIRAQDTIVHFSFPQNLVLGPDEKYFNPDEIEDFIQSVHARYPDITEVRVIGKTLEGRNILAIKISDNAKVDEKEPVLLVNGMHHAREVMTTEVTTDMVEYLTSNYGSNAEVTKWVNNTEIWVIPMFNLDGNNKMWSDNPMWRKNTRDGHGVDINRNYPTFWGSCGGSSGRAGAQDYRGKAPASEPETQSMMNFVANIKPVFNISYHSYSEIVIYPFGCSPKRTPNEEVVELIGKEMGKKLDYKPGTAWELLYNADGGDIDWMYTEHQVIPYAIEVNDMEAGFHPNYDKYRNKTVEKNRLGWMHLLSKLQGPSLQGEVLLSDYTKIEINKAGSANLMQTYKINPDGTYYVMLKSGLYDVTFKGTKTKTFKNVSVTEKKSFVF